MKRAGIFSKILFGFLLGLSFDGCNNTEPTGAVEVIRSGDASLYVASTLVWSNTQIPVCWENPDASNQQNRNLVQKAVEDTWERSSLVDFVGWGTCVAGSMGVRIAIADEGPHVKALGRSLSGISNGMVLNFTFQKWGDACRTSIDFCIRAIAVHEFGHALGFAHEQNRPDTPLWCNDIQGSNGDVTIGPWDISSVMNYCNPEWNNNGELSQQDNQAVRAVYGGDFIIEELVPWSGYNVTAGQWLIGDMNGDGRADLIHRYPADYIHPWIIQKNGQYSVSAFKPRNGYNISAGQWIVDDITGDQRADIVHLYPSDYIHPWLTAGNGSFDVTTFKPWDGYNISAGQWLSGDISGDGKKDLIHIPGTNSVHAWISKGDGSFHIGTFAPKADYNTVAGKWMIGDITGDGKADLIHLYPADYVYSWISSGDGSFTVGSYRPWAGYNISAGQWLSCDLNGDGKSDMVHMPATDSIHSWISRGDGNFDIGTFKPWGGYNTTAGQWITGDFNEDGKEDLIHLYASDFAYVWISNGDGSFAVGSFKPWSGYAVGDGRWLAGKMNGDGKVDLVHVNSAGRLFRWLSGLPKGYKYN